MIKYQFKNFLDKVYKIEICPELDYQYIIYRDGCNYGLSSYMGNIKKLWTGIEKLQELYTEDVIDYTDNLVDKFRKNKAFM